MRNQKLYLVQLLRAVAASAVVIAHSALKVTNGGINCFWSFLGAFGVFIFFVLSGFIIFFSSGKYAGKHGGAKEFLIRRYVRIAPMYYLATFILLMADLAQSKGNHSVIEVVTSLLFIPYAQPGRDYIWPVLGQGWTLIYEMFFYICFSFCLLIKRRHGLPILFCGFMALAFFGTYWSYQQGHLIIPTNLFEYFCSPIILLFLCGVVIGIAHEKCKKHRVSMSVALLLSTTIMVIDVWLLSYAPPEPLSFTVLIILWISACLLVYLCAFVREIKTSHFFRRVESFGDYSYSMYLFHVFIVIVVWKFFKNIVVVDNIQTSTFYLYLATCVIATLAVASFIYRYLEKPMSSPSFWSSLLKRVKDGE